MCDRYGGLPKGLVRGKIINGALNLLSIIFAQVYFPTYSHGLKDIASFIGAHWQAPQANGLHTILWRSEWERTRVVSLKDQLIAYNRDDCAALALLAEERNLLRSGEFAPGLDNLRKSLRVADFDMKKSATFSMQIARFSRESRFFARKLS